MQGVASGAGRLRLPNRDVYEGETCYLPLTTHYSLTTYFVLRTTHYLLTLPLTLPRRLSPRSANPNPNPNPTPNPTPHPTQATSTKACRTVSACCAVRRGTLLSGWASGGAVGAWVAGW